MLLRPGGLAVVTARPWRQHGELVDLPAAVIAAGARAGLVPVARCVALLAGLRERHGCIARPSFFQLDNLRRARAKGEPWHLIVHEDVLIFRNTPPAPADSVSATTRGPPGETAPRTRASAPHGRAPRRPGTSPGRWPDGPCGRHRPGLRFAASPYAVAGRAHLRGQRRAA